MTALAIVGSLLAFVWIIAVRMSASPWNLGDGSATGLRNLNSPL